ncbi:MAG: protein kinase [Alphaproteobacteria bacterium]|nr:protein kinase [Alphaproteobacteria bacterium]
MESGEDLLTVGSSVEKYVVEGVLGQGGMARVYRVRHRTLDTVHALKILTSGSAAIKKRALQEGRVQAGLRHTNIVSVTDVLDLPSGPGLILEFVNGSDLEVLVERRKKLTIPQIDQLMAGILRGVAFAHHHGLVHRDLKPANILLAVQGNQLVPKVADFGLVKDTVGGLGSTRTGVAMGTPRYMSPEQIRDAKHVDQRTDIFALGAILYFLVTGRPAHAPFTDDVFEVFSAVVEGKRTPASELRPDAPARMLDAIEGALQSDRDERFGTVEEMELVLFGRSGESAWDMDELTGAVEANTGEVPPETPDLSTLGSATFEALPPPVQSSPTYIPTPGPAPEKTLAPPDLPTPAPRTPSSPVLPVLIGFAGLTALGVGVLIALAFGSLVIPGEPAAGVSAPPGGAPVAPAPVAAPAPEPVPEPVSAPVPEAQPVAEPVPEPAPVAAPVPEPAPVSEPARPVAAPAPIQRPRPVDPAPQPVPDPEPVVAPEPVAAPDPAPEPVAAAPTKAHFVATGARARLRGAGRELEPGDVAPGTYKVWAFFDGADGKTVTVEGATVSVGAGQTVHVTCKPFLKLCETEVR